MRAQKLAALIMLLALPVSAQQIKPTAAFGLGYPKGLSFSAGVSANDITLIEVSAGSFLPPFPYWSLTAACEVSVGIDAGLGVGFTKMGGFDKSIEKADHYIYPFVSYPPISADRSWFGRGGLIIGSSASRQLYPYFEVGFQF
jgi:hypothetical protein